MEICYVQNCKKKADFICSCSNNIFVCTEHILVHQDVGFHSMQLLYNKLEKSIQEKAIKALNSTVNSLNDAILIAKTRSEELIERINFSLASTLMALYSQREYYQEMLQNCSNPKGISKIEYKKLWRILKSLGSRDLWRITDFSGDILTNPILISLKTNLNNLSKMTDKIEAEIIQNASSNFALREMIEFIAQLKYVDLEKSIKNASKISNKLKTPEFLKIPLSCPKVFKPNFQNFSGLGIFFNFKEEVEANLTVSSAVTNFLEQELTKIVLRTAKNFSSLKPYIPEVLENYKVTDIVEFISAISISFPMTNQELIRILIEKYEFKPYCNLIKQFFLLGQGDFFYLMFEELFIHERVFDLDTLMEECYWKSNAKKIPEKYFKSLSIKLDEETTELGWESYKLEIDLKYPLSFFFSKEIVSQLQKSFSFIWQLRKVDFLLKQISYKRKILSFDPPPGLKALVHKVNIFRFRLTSFVNASLFFFMEEVIEVAWKRFLCLFNESQDLEDVDIAIKDLIRYIRLFNFSNKQFLSQYFFGILRIIVKFVDLQREIEEAVSEDFQEFEVEKHLEEFEELKKSFNVELDKFKSELNFSQTKLFYFFQIKLDQL